MSIVHRSRIVAAVGVLAVFAALVPASVSGAIPGRGGGPDCAPVLDGPRGGAQAVAELGANIERGAKRAGMSTAQFARELRKDATLRVDVCGYPFYVEPVASAGSADAHGPNEHGSDEHASESQAGPGVAGALNASGDVFALASRPGSLRTIYLNFKGATVSGTGWNSYFSGGAPIVAPAFSLDADGSTFTVAEQDVIREVWLRVAEDFASFDVNVTTADPGAAAINRSSSSDDTYGTVALITNDSLIYGQCGCGGIAYLGVFDLPGSNTVYQPAWVFALGMHGSAKYIADAATHELGHNLGLYHDGTVAHDGVAAVGYYTGQGAWAPIMGVGYYRPVSQWSKGEYAYADNPQDDLSVINSHGLLTVLDDHGDSPGSATALGTASAVSGIVGTAADTDWFAFRGSGTTTITATTQTAGANLDIELALYDDSGNLLASADPAVVMEYPGKATGLDATLTKVLAAGTYFVEVDGVGFGSASLTGYSDYASLGRYDVSLATTPPPPDPVVILTGSLLGGTVLDAYSATLKAAGGSLPYTWSILAGSMPPGLNLTSGGVISGTPTSEGTYPITVKVSDARAQTDTADLSLVVQAAPLAVTTSTLPSGEVGVGYEATLEASGGSLPYDWEITSGSLPEGLSLQADGVISGTPVADGTFSVTVQVSDSRARTDSAELGLVVQASPLTVTTSALPDGRLAVAYEARVAASGGSRPYSWEVTAGSLPEGLTLGADGAIVGTPILSTTADFTVMVTDSLGNSASKSLILAITEEPVVITTTTLPVGSFDRAYSVTLEASGGIGPYLWHRTSGKLPPGLTLSSTGLISGRPTRTGNFKVAITVTDAMGTMVSRTFPMKVTP